MGPVRQSTNAPSETLTVVAKAKETVLEPSGTVESFGFHQGHVENGDVYGKQYMKQSLVDGIPTPLKNMKVSWDHYSQNMEKEKMFQTTNQIMYQKQIQT